MDAQDLAQLSFAVFAWQLDDPILQPFLADIDQVELEAEVADGFRWRHQVLGQSHDNPFPEDHLVTMSTWSSVDHLHAFVDGGQHLRDFQTRHHWFRPAADPCQVLWWVPEGHEPDLHEGFERLVVLRAEGPTAAAFTLARPFEPVVDQSTPDLSRSAN